MRKVITIIVVLALLGAVVYGVYAALERVRERREAALAEREERMPTVVVDEVKRGNISRNTHVIGNARAITTVSVAPKVGGRLKLFELPDGRPIEAGERVNEGDVLAVIERDELQNAVEQADAALAVAQARLSASRVALLDAEREKERATSLFERGAATEQHYDRAVNVYERTQAEIRLAEAQVVQAQRSLEAAEIKLGHATVTAPVSGVISRKMVERGDMVGTGSPIVTIEQDDEIKIIGSTSERNLGQIKVGETRAIVKFDARPDVDFQGVVHRIGATIDPVSRTVEVEVRMPNHAHRVKPGMFARVSLVLEQRTDVPLIEERAIVRDGDDAFVYVVNDESIKVRPVSLGLRSEGMNEIIDGVQPGELVVVRRDRHFEGGENVQVIKFGEVD